MNNTLLQKVIAEFIGTFILVFFGCGSIATIDKNIPTNGLFVSLSFALALMIMIYSLGGVSGAHFNPAVTFGLTLTKRFPLKDLVPYWVAQSAGALAAISILRETLTNKFAEINYAANIASNQIPPGTSFAIELITTATLTFVIVAVTANKNSSKVISGIAISSTILMCSLVFGPVSGVSMNPARSIGPALIEGKEAIKCLWIFTLGPLVGGALGAILFEAFRTRDN